MLFSRVFFMLPLGMPCLLHCVSGLTKPTFLQNIKNHHVVVGQGPDSWEKGRRVTSTHEMMWKMDFKKIVLYESEPVQN